MAGFALLGILSESPGWPDRLPSQVRGQEKRYKNGYSLCPSYCLLQARPFRLLPVLTMVVAGFRPIKAARSREDASLIGFMAAPGIAVPQVLGCEVWSGGGHRLPEGDLIEKLAKGIPNPFSEAVAELARKHVRNRRPEG